MWWRASPAPNTTRKHPAARGLQQITAHLRDKYWDAAQHPGLPGLPQRACKTYGLSHLCSRRTFLAPADRRGFHSAHSFLFARSRYGPWRTNSPDGLSGKMSMFCLGRQLGGDGPRATIAGTQGLHQFPTRRGVSLSMPALTTGVELNRIKRCQRGCLPFAWDRGTDSVDLHPRPVQKLIRPEFVCRMRDRWSEVGSAIGSSEHRLLRGRLDRKRPYVRYL